MFFRHDMSEFYSHPGCDQSQRFVVPVVGDGVVCSRIEDDPVVISVTMGVESDLLLLRACWVVVSMRVQITTLGVVMS